MPSENCKELELLRHPSSLRWRSSFPLRMFSSSHPALMNTSTDRRTRLQMKALEMGLDYEAEGVNVGVRHEGR